MAETRVILCDMCGTPDAKSFSIGERGMKPWVIDLCETCREPLEIFRQNARSGTGQRRPYRKLRKVALKTP